MARAKRLLSWNGLKGLGARDHKYFLCMHQRIVDYFEFLLVTANKAMKKVARFVSIQTEKPS